VNAACAFRRLCSWSLVTGGWRPSLPDPAMPGPVGRPRAVGRLGAARAAMWEACRALQASGSLWIIPPSKTELSPCRSEGQCWQDREMRELEQAGLAPSTPGRSQCHALRPSLASLSAPPAPQRSGTGRQAAGTGLFFCPQQSAAIGSRPLQPHTSEDPTLRDLKEGAAFCGSG